MPDKLPEDHPIVKDWIVEAYKAGPGGLVVVPIACTVRTKSGKERQMPPPPLYVAPHLRRIGNDDEGRPLYQSV